MAVPRYLATTGGIGPMTMRAMNRFSNRNPRRGGIGSLIGRPGKVPTNTGGAVMPMLPGFGGNLPRTPEMTNPGLMPPQLGMPFPPGMQAPAAPSPIATTGNSTLLSNGQVEYNPITPSPSPNTGLISPSMGGMPPPFMGGMPPPFMGGMPPPMGGMPPPFMGSMPSMPGQDGLPSSISSGGGFVLTPQYQKPPQQFVDYNQMPAGPGTVTTGTYYGPGYDYWNQPPTNTQPMNTQPTMGVGYSSAAQTAPTAMAGGFPEGGNYPNSSFSGGVM